MAPVRDVYFFGHSNGGFMSYRMACDHADRITAIGSLAGSDAWTECTPSQPVSVLQVHGDMDDTISYDGVNLGYPSAPDAAARWAALGGCADTTTPGDALDIDTGLDGAETTVANYETGCTDADASLWTIVGGAHLPAFTGGPFSAELLSWLDARRR